MDDGDLIATVTDDAGEEHTLILRFLDRDAAAYEAMRRTHAVARDAWDGQVVAGLDAQDESRWVAIPAGRVAHLRVRWEPR